MRYLVVGYDYFFYPYFQSYFDNYEDAERTARFLMQSQDVLAVKIAKNAKVKKWEKK